jgi:hypothetical protein
MSLHEEIKTAIQTALRDCVNQDEISPTILAACVQKIFAQETIEPHIEYTSREHLKQMARKELAGRFEPDGEKNSAHEDQTDLFGDVLQVMYPIEREKGTEPIYKKRESLTDAQVTWNIWQLKKSADARNKHADALQAWLDAR